MTLRRRLVDWALTGVLILVPALVLRASLSRGTPTLLDQALLRITAPLETCVSWVIEGIGGTWSRYVALVDVEAENRELRDDNERLRKELAAVTRRAYDVAALEDLAVVKKRTPADTLGARVIGAPLSPQFRVLRLKIDRGEREVAPDMPVITSEGPVGRVEKVYGDYADVVLISDPSSRIDVVLRHASGASAAEELDGAGAANGAGGANDGGAGATGGANAAGGANGIGGANAAGGANAMAGASGIGAANAAGGASGAGAASGPNGAGAASAANGASGAGAASGTNGASGKSSRGNSLNGGAGASGAVASSGARGLLVGLGRADSYACKIEWLERSRTGGPADAKVKVGDEVVTSGLGASFPPGLVVGRVSKIVGDDGMFQSVEVKPTVDVSRVRAVMVLLAPPPPPDPDAKSKRRSEPAFGARPL